MISTSNCTALPDKEALQRLCKALAVLDAIKSPEWEYRYYSYNAKWAKSEAFFEMRNGSGDQMLLLFREEGCVINGFMHEYKQADKAELTRGLPPVFEKFIAGEPVNSIGTTFCIWYTAPLGWQTGLIKNDEDGSQKELHIFDANPQTYVDWASEYFDDGDEETGEMDLRVIAQIYEGEVLTKLMVLAISPEIEDWTQLKKDLHEIDYPYNFG